MARLPKKNPKCKECHKEIIIHGKDREGFLEDPRGSGDFRHMHACSNQFLERGVEAGEPRNVAHGNIVQ